MWENIFLFSFIALFVSINNHKIYNDLYSWGVNNSLEISEKIEMIFKDVNNKTYRARAQINENETILHIPHKIMLNMEVALNLLDSKKLKKQYQKYVKEKIEEEYADAKNYNLNSTPDNSTLQAEKGFLAYILYLVQHKPKHYQKTKFYEFFKYYIETFENNLSRLPLFYTSEQLEVLLGLSMSHLVMQLKNVYEEEADNFSKKYYKQTLNYDDFYRYRVFTKVKAYNITGNNTMVPFLDLFKTDYFKYNANFTIEDNGDVRIFATKQINKNEIVVIAEKELNNMYRYILYGKTYDEFIGDIPFYMINAFSPTTYYIYKLSEDERDFYDEYKIDLADANFINKSISQYRALHEKFGKTANESDLFYYDVLRTNLRYYKEYFDIVTQERIYNAFYNPDDIINIQRILQGEKNLVYKCYEQVDEKFLEVMAKDEEDENYDEEDFINDSNENKTENETINDKNKTTMNETKNDKVHDL